MLPVATKEYQTSSFTPVAAHVGAVATEGVAEAVVPVVVTAQARFTFTVKLTAAMQLSLAGGGGGVPMQIVKLAKLPGVATTVHTLT